MIAISINHVSKAYGHYEVLHDITLTIPRGECFVLFGANGSGKTTLLKILATLQRPNSGKIQIFGYDGLKEKESIREIMIFLAHGSYLYEDLNANENLKFWLALRGLSPTDREIKAALDRVAIGEFFDMKVRSFSAGMKKRLALARTMLARPSILLLDEPFTGLDGSGTEIMKDYIRETTARNGAVLLSTHDYDKIRDIANQSGILQQGILKPFSLEANKIQ